MILGIDVGGTYTDGVLTDQQAVIQSAKRPTEQSCDHGRFYVDRSQRLSGSRRVATDDIILKLFQATVVYTVLCHRAKTGIDAINHFVRRKLT